MLLGVLDIENFLGGSQKWPESDCLLDKENRILVLCHKSFVPVKSAKYIPIQNGSKQQWCRLPKDKNICLFFTLSMVWLKREKLYNPYDAAAL